MSCGSSCADTCIINQNDCENIQITLCLFKPDLVERKIMGKVLQDILDAGFNIEAIDIRQLKEFEAKEFYKEHKDKGFFEDMVKDMMKSPIYALILSKENAIDDFRKLLGHTDPSKADEGTLRKKYGLNIGQNSFHGSDSMTSAERELDLIFSVGSCF